MMSYGFENDKFYLEFTSCSRPYGNMKEESDRRAVSLAEQGGKYLLCLSGGLDSQSVLHSFHTQGIPLETAFLYLPTYNDNEYEQVKFLDNKYGIKTQVVDLDPYKHKDEIIAISEESNVPSLVNAIQSKFVSLLPDNADIIQMVHDPFVYISPTHKFYYYQGFYLPEISRERSFSFLKRQGKHIMYGNTAEFLLSILTDDLYVGALHSSEYFDGNGLGKELCHLTTVDRWDYYIKPLLYGKYWKDELTYFPKFAGKENIDFINVDPKYWMFMKTHAAAIPYYEFIDFMKTQGSVKNRYYENVTLDMGPKF